MGASVKTCEEEGVCVGPQTKSCEYPFRGSRTLDADAGRGGPGVM